MSFFTIKQSVESEINVRRSVFRAYLFPVRGAEEARGMISNHQQQYSNATHNCYAYICGIKQEVQYYSDAGEPHGTAGKPILNALLRAGLTNILAIVTRYYGGINLGVPGLISAYGVVTETAISISELIEALTMLILRITTDYAVSEQLTAYLKTVRGEITASSWKEKVQHDLRIPEENLPQLREYLDVFARQGRLDYIIDPQEKE
jgi:uncharacterized YigZ family protein